MWIVVVVEHYYPSVFHFDNKDEALTCYKKNKDSGRMGHAVHLAKVEESNYCKEIYEFDENKIEALDVEWYTER